MSATLFDEANIHAAPTSAKRWLKPPLAFQGNKKNQLKRFLGVVSNFEITPATVFVDVFGGSGLLAHWLKAYYPQNRVIWNDFDDYAARLANIAKTEAHRRELAAMLPARAGGLRLKSGEEARLRTWVSARAAAGEWLDCIQLSSWLLFSGNYTQTPADFIKQTHYSRIPAQPLCADGYLDGVERVQKDYRELLAEFDGADAVLVLDPPYLQTNIECYSSGFRLADFLNVAEAFLNARRAVFFSSERSNAGEFFDWLGRRFGRRLDFKTMRGDLMRNGKTAATQPKNVDVMYYKDGREGELAAQIAGLAGADTSAEGVAK